MSPCVHIVCSFNTSHVKVNPNINQDLERLNDSFNTSHVKVNRKSLSASSGSVLRVSIHPMLKLIPTFWHYSGRRMGVSIHPMLKLIVTAAFGSWTNVFCFNTSHVKVNREKITVELSTEAGFQYIPC